MSDTPIAPVAGGLTLAALIPGLVAAINTLIAPAAGAVGLASVASSVTKPTVTAIAPTVGALAVAGVASTFALGVGPLVSVEVPGESGTIVWPAIANGLVGVVSPRLRYRCASFQATGVFGAGGSIKLQGSNDGINWGDLTPAALTGAGLFAGLGASERPKFLRPNCTAGDATTSITITAWLS